MLSISETSASFHFTRAQTRAQGGCKNLSTFSIFATLLQTPNDQSPKLFFTK